MKLPARTALTAGVSTASIIVFPYLVNLMLTLLPGFLAPIASLIVSVLIAAGLPG
ncbi:MAG: hypothetical protein AB8A43_08355 [Prochlorococcus sp.]